MDTEFTFQQLRASDNLFCRKRDTLSKPSTVHPTMGHKGCNPKHRSPWRQLLGVLGTLTLLTACGSLDDEASDISIEEQATREFRESLYELSDNYRHEAIDTKLNLVDRPPEQDMMALGERKSLGLTDPSPSIRRSLRNLATRADLNVCKFIQEHVPYFGRLDQGAYLTIGFNLGASALISGQIAVEMVWDLATSQMATFWYWGTGATRGAGFGAGVYMGAAVNQHPYQDRRNVMLGWSGWFLGTEASVPILPWLNGKGMIFSGAVRDPDTFLKPNRNIVGMAAGLEASTPKLPNTVVNLEKIDQLIKSLPGKELQLLTRLSAVPLQPGFGATYYKGFNLWTDFMYNLQKGLFRGKGESLELKQVEMDGKLRSLVQFRAKKYDRWGRPVKDANGNHANDVVKQHMMQAMSVGAATLSPFAAASVLARGIMLKRYGNGCQI